MNNITEAVSEDGDRRGTLPKLLRRELSVNNATN